jgi:hypothetical protein
MTPTQLKEAIAELGQLEALQHSVKGWEEVVAKDPKAVAWVAVGENDNDIDCELSVNRLIDAATHEVQRMKRNLKILGVDFSES